MIDLFIADAHLLDPQESSYRRLLAFLDSRVGDVRTLCLAGDIFDFWIGYRAVVFSPYVPLLAALLRHHEAGARIVCIEGNHDFNLGPFFRERLKAEIFPDSGELILDNERIYVCHGDLLDPADHGYRLWRRLLRSSGVRLLGAVVPAAVAWKLAQALSLRSRRKRQDRPFRNPLPLIEAHAARRFAEGYDTVVTGHFHTPLLHSVNGRTVIALGDAGRDCSCVIREAGLYRLHTY